RRASRSAAVLQMLPLLAAVSVVLLSVLLVFLRTFSGEKRKRTLLDPNVKYPLPLIHKQEISHDTKKLRFGLPSGEHALGLPVGQHVYLSARVGGSLVVRAYTPISSDQDLGYVDLLVKVYHRNTHPSFPEGGKLSQHLDSLSIGDTVDFRGPSGLLVYKDHGRFSIRPDKKAEPQVRRFREVAMIAGGTGITPMLQLIRRITAEPSDRTKCSLIFANQTEKDILLREELEQLETEHPENLRVWFTLDRPEPGWRFGSGFVTRDMMEQRLPAAAPDVLVVLCGPPAMIQNACLPNLDRLGHQPHNIFTY
uniref:NADH-cytochrome b5 reductase n=1 Tax=Salarias fasciatus TaxID=181472 RepID=A0A672I2V8_SALFA